MEMCIPVDLLIFSARHRLIKPSRLRTFLLIKSLCPDRFTLDQEVYNSLSTEMGINVKTLKSHIQSLLEANFLGFDSATRTVFVRGYGTIQHIIKGRSRYRVRVRTQDIYNINELILAAAVAYHSKIYSSKKHMPELKNSGSQQGFVKKGKILKGYAPLAVSFLGKVLGKSTSWIDRKKKLAIEKGYLSRVKDFMDTNVIWAERLHYFVAFPDFNGRARRVSGKLCIVGIDLLKSNFSLRKKRG